jgi:two-component system sensor histidine kinase ChvG
MRSVTLIEQALSRLDGLVSAARHMDEVSAELLDPPRQPIDLSKLVAQVGEDYADTIADTGRRLAIGPLERATVKGGEDLIETVLENLLDNAESFSPEGGEIRLALGVEDHTAVLTVEDQGPGVPPADIERIFDRYFSVRAPTGAAAANGELAHFGIGLWVVRRNVEALGGTVRAENRKPHGLRVKVSLPLA